MQPKLPQNSHRWPLPAAQLPLLLLQVPQLCRLHHWIQAYSLGQARLKTLRQLHLEALHQQFTACHQGLLCPQGRALWVSPTGTPNSMGTLTSTGTLCPWTSQHCNQQPNLAAGALASGPPCPLSCVKGLLVSPRQKVIFSLQHVCLWPLMIRRRPHLNVPGQLGQVA